jgi:deoxycytidylate deaminase
MSDTRITREKEIPRDLARVDEQPLSGLAELPQRPTEDVPPTAPERTPPNYAIDLAVEVSGWSPCRSKRGVVLFGITGVVAHGYNYKPRGFDCDGSDTCKATCRVEAVHAEQQALLSAGYHANGCDMVHVKTVNSALVASGGPSCVACSKLALVAGVVGVWLYHADGWHRYTAHDFHYESLSVAKQRERFSTSCISGRSGQRTEHLMTDVSTSDERTSSRSA